MIINTTTQCAKLLRAELKKTFPSVKFSVTKASYTHIDVRYNDATLSAQDVHKITDEYEYGEFNGYEDIYESKKLSEQKEFSCKYIFVMNYATY